MNNTPETSSLGKTTHYPRHYDPALLFPIERAVNRAQLGIADALPFHGVDIWNAYEMSWLEPGGKPHVAMAELRVPAQSPYLIESKSLKLYLNGFNGERMDEATVRQCLTRDLSKAAGMDVYVTLHSPTDITALPVAPFTGILLDDIDVDCNVYDAPDAMFLRVSDEPSVEEILVSHLLKSNCPVTGQPDWASVRIAYSGKPIDRVGLLRYIVSYREHAEFHEQCVERMYVDIMHRCAPEKLAVYARYTRRGGLDINPFRSNTPMADIPDVRTMRQ